MGVIRCENGHFYDDSKFQCCPHCDQQSAFQRNHAYANIDSTAQSADVHFANVSFQPPAVSAAPAAAAEEDLDVTIGVLQNEELQPAVGWTVILSGKRRGKDFTLRGGINPLTDFCETPEERAVRIIYDPRGNQYLLEAENPAMHILLNGNALEQKLTPLEGKSKLTCGATEFLFVPLCDGEMKWEDD